MIAILIVLLVLLIVCASVFACDFLPVFLTWLKRIHIGRFSSDEERLRFTKNASYKQLKKLPPMPITDRTAYTLLPRLRGEYVNSNFNCWQIACLLLGLDDDENAKKAAYRYFEKADLQNSPYTIGNAMLLYALMRSGYGGDERVRSAADRYLQAMLKLAGEKTLPYNPASRNHFVDTLGMACPFLFLYDRLYGCKPAWELAVRQLNEYYTFGIHPVTGLPAHCFDSSNGFPAGLYGWGRGCGWLAIGLADSIDALRKDDPYRSELIKRAEQYAKALPAFMIDGGFNSIMGQPSSRFDSSATAILGWFMAYISGLTGYNSLRTAAMRCSEKIASNTRRSGEVDFAQGDTMGVGNYSRRFDILPAAQGFALRLEAELCR